MHLGDVLGGFLFEDVDQLSRLWHKLRLGVRHVTGRGIKIEGFGGRE